MVLSVAIGLTRQFQQIQFQNISNNGYIVLLQNFLREDLARIDCSTKVVSLSKRDVYQPDTTTSLVAFEVGVVVVQESEHRRNDDRHTLPIGPCACFQIYAKSLFCSFVSVRRRCSGGPVLPSTEL